MSDRPVITDDDTLEERAKKLEQRFGWMMCRGTTSWTQSSDEIPLGSPMKAITREVRYLIDSIREQQGVSVEKAATILRASDKRFQHMEASSICDKYYRKKRDDARNSFFEHLFDGNYLDAAEVWLSLSDADKAKLNQ